MSLAGNWPRFSNERKCDHFWTEICRRLLFHCFMWWQIHWATTDLLDVSRHSDTVLTDTAFTDTIHTDTAFTDTVLTDTAFTDTIHTDTAHSDTAHSDTEPIPTQNPYRHNLYWHSTNFDAFKCLSRLSNLCSCMPSVVIHFCVQCSFKNNIPVICACNDLLRILSNAKHYSIMLSTIALAITEE